MKIYAIYNQNNKFIAAFPDRENAMNFGITLFGPEKGWEYCIKEMWLYETKQYIFSQPLTQPVPYTPYTPPIPPKTTPYEPNIWCEVKGPKGRFGGIGPTGVFAPGTK